MRRVWKNEMLGRVLGASFAGLARSAGLALGATVLTSAALGQVQSVDPYYGVIVEKTQLQCFHTETAYTVTELQVGQILRVDGEGPRWARVSYPVGKVAAFVRADDAKVENGELKLVNPSRLWAINAMRGFSGSWKALLDTELPAGTQLKLTEPSMEKDGNTVTAYRVVAPEGARGYIDAKAIKRAGEAEVEAYRQQLAQGGMTLPALAKGGATPKSDKSATEPKAEPKTDVAAKPAPGADLTSPMTPGGDAKTAANTTPATDDPNNTGVRPVATKPPTAAGNTATATPAPERRVGTLEQLEETFQLVYKQPSETAEFDALIGEYQRLVESTPASENRRRAQANARLETLKLKRDVRDRVRALKAEQAKVDAGSSEIQQAMAEVEKTRVYTIIGQLQPSTVYDGNRLPQMFRVQSVGDVTPRTLGYLKPTPELQLEKKVGLVIGVVGEAQLDPALHLNVITPVRVDTLRPGSSAPGVAPTADANKPAE